MNSDVIRLLPDSVANQIAAGEVIQRPASVIKELVENAVDAGATEISIILKDAGRSLIQVVDNGCGMSPADARMAFERHATSKIAAACDLYSLHTMGFRGEALPSIAAVAQIDLRTMRHDDTIGTRILISESKLESQEPASCVPGTNLMVKNLFFHMPARRKFLKKDSIELSHILREFERLALVNTAIDFTLIHNETTLHQFRHGTLKQRIGSLFGKNLESQIAAINTETSLVKISGFIGMPRFAKKRGAQQFLFVNGRNMRHPFFHKAILKCYEQLISPDSQPSYFVNFEVDPATIDVNIHPQKHEIKFEHEQAIWQILEAAVRETLGKTQAAGALDFDSDEAPDIPLFDPNSSVAMPEEAFDEGYNPFRPASDNSAHVVQPSTVVASSGGNTWHRPAARPAQDWQKLYDNFNRERTNAFASGQSNEVAPLSSAGDLFGEVPVDENEIARESPCFQLHNSYIVSSSRKGIMVISQRRAHIRILYDRYLELLAGGKMASQALLFPEDFELPASLASIAEDNMDEINRIGFIIKHNGGTRWSVTSIPAPMQGVSSIETIISILEEIADKEDTIADSLNNRIALSMARSMAIKSVQPLSRVELDTLEAELFACTDPSFTPDGLPIMTIIDNDEIDRRFMP